MNDGKAMEAFADNLWNNYMKQKVEALIQNDMRAFRAFVTANPGGGALTVQRPFDAETMTLKCVGSLSGASIGTQVICVELGSLSNAFVLCRADLGNL